jgi:signal transduction histidine kinase
MQGPPLILYVDDERPNRIVFEQSLAGELNVRCVPDAASALAVLDQVEVAVVVTDMRMPQMAGDELLRIVKARWPATIRMVITAHSEIEPILTAINDGLVARYLIKPWQRSELVQVLRWAVEAWSFGRESGALQRRLLETERLATLGSIAGAVVHDLNQPLAGLTINATRLLDHADAAEPLRRWLAGAPPDLDDRDRLNELAVELAELARDLHASALHLRGVTSSLGQYLYARPGPRPPASTDPIPVVRDAISACHDLAIKARGQIRYDGPAAVAPVRIDATELTQVMINLIANAAQALLASPRRDGSGRVTVVARPGGGIVTLEVHDNGVGMSADVLARVGTPFFTTRDDGIGLGVAQCQRLVGAAGGTFRIDSEPGVGTTVTATLPTAVMDL